MRQRSLRFLSANDWTILANRVERRTFRLGDEIIHAGARLNHIYIIRAGSASVELPTPRCTLTVSVLEPGDVCGELAFLGDGLTTAAVVARDTEVAVDAIHICDLQSLFREIPGFGLRMYQSLAVSVAERLKYTSGELIRALTSKPSP